MLRLATSIEQREQSSILHPRPQKQEMPLAHRMGEGGAERRVRAAESHINYQLKTINYLGSKNGKGKVKF